MEPTSDRAHLLRHAPLSLSKRTLNMGHKIPYVDVISDAILQSPDRRLTAKEIFELVSVKYGPMKKTETLKVFRKVQRGRQKKPNWWTVDEEMLYAVGQAEHDQQQQQQQQQQLLQHQTAAEWSSSSAHSVGNTSHHGIAQQLTREVFPARGTGKTSLVSPTFGGPGPAPPVCGYPSASNQPPSVFFGNGPLTQPSTEYNSPSAFQEPSRIGHNYYGQPGIMTSPETRLAAGMHPAMMGSYPHHQSPMGDVVRSRGGHYVISVEDLAANGLRPPGPITMFPTHPPMTSANFVARGF